MNKELFLTEDGSHTLYVPDIDECYHSSHGAIQESKHVFIDAGLKALAINTIRILEVGFGTGLNAYLSLLEAMSNHKYIDYTALELYPVEVERALQLNYPPLLSPDRSLLFEKLHRAEWNEKVEINPDFYLTKLQQDFTRFATTEKFDLIYFDAFSPEKQPEMWTDEMFRHLYQLCNADAVLTTYCAKGFVRRSLQSAGFRVERLAGPPGKREILRCIKK